MFFDIIFYSTIISSLSFTYADVFISVLYSSNVFIAISFTMLAILSCGASIDVNANGKCPYCGTIYNLEDKDWVLTFIEIR